jgi:hypothetical protein
VKDPRQINELFNSASTNNNKKIKLNYDNFLMSGHSFGGVCAFGTGMKYKCI